jgi:hypothetical protein
MVEKQLRLETAMPLFHHCTGAKRTAETIAAAQPALFRRIAFLKEEEEGAAFKRWAPLCRELDALRVPPGSCIEDEESAALEEAGEKKWMDQLIAENPDERSGPFYHWADPPVPPPLPPLEQCSLPYQRNVNASRRSYLT